MAGKFRFQVCRKRTRAGLNISALLIKRGQVLTQIYDENVHEARSLLTTVFLRREHQKRSDSTLLAGRIDGQQSQVRSFTAPLDVDTSDEVVPVRREQERALCQQLLHFSLADAIAIHKEVFDDAKCGVDNSSYLCGVSRRSEPNGKSAVLTDH